MSPVDRLSCRLLVLCFLLLACDVNCENPQRGYVLHAKAGHYPMGVHNDNKGYERWSEPRVFRRPTTGYKTSSMDSSQSGNIYLAQDHTTDSKSSQIQSHYPYPVLLETQNSNVPKTKANRLNFGFRSGSVTRGQSTVVYNCSGNKAVTFPDGEKIHQANSDSVFSTGSVQFPARIYRARAKTGGGFSPVHADKAPVGFGPNNRKSLSHSHSSIANPNKAIKSGLRSESHKHHVKSSIANIQRLHPQKSRLKTRPEVSGYRSAFISSNSFKYDRTNSLPEVLKPADKKTDSIMKGRSPGRNSAGKANTQMPYLPWRPRVYSSDVLPEPRGYAHVRHLKPAFDKTQPQASSATGRKFLETGFPSVSQKEGSYSHDSTKPGFGLGVPTPSERQLNFNNNVRGSQSSSWHLPPPDRAQVPVQGKFKPFQILPTNNNLSADSLSSDNETAPSQTFAGTTLPPSLNSTGITSTVVPSVSRKQSTKSSSPMLTEGKDAEPLPPASNLQGRSNSSAEAGLSLDQIKSFQGFFSKLQPAGTEIKGDKSSTKASVWSGV
ncbi:uncharacterized protein [Trachinotus anak]|uniref:uncharacterized protein n=1 Tax=Trachinotus anak TaxID=443729 RepID=UPI0039F2329E